jgi:hypothetical protein
MPDPSSAHDLTLAASADLAGPAHGPGRRTGTASRGRPPATGSGQPTQWLRIGAISKHARQDSNLRPLAPEANALSTELRARADA